MNSVTIIIPFFGQQAQEHSALQECLKSLEETVEFPIIISHNGPYACPVIPSLHIYDQGQCKAVNAAAALVNTQWIFVTNDDMIYAPQTLEKLLDTAQRHKLKFVCPNLVEPQQGAPPFLTQPFGGAGGDFNKEAWLEFASKHHDDTLEEGFNLPFLIDRETWQRIGGYDINYDPWGSNGDSDLQAKLILAGLDTFRDRNVIVYHFSQTSGTFEPQNRVYWQKNYDYFTQKWGFERQPSDKVWYSQDIINRYKLIYKPEWMCRLGRDMVGALKKFNSY